MVDLVRGPRSQAGLLVGVDRVDDVAALGVDAAGAAEAVLWRVEFFALEVLRGDVRQCLREQRIPVEALAACEPTHAALLGHLMKIRDSGRKARVDRVKASERGEQW